MSIESRMRHFHCCDRRRDRSRRRANTFTGSPTFEVASIKPNKSGDGRVLIGFQPGGRFTATGITLRMLIAIAYGTPQPLPNFRIIGGPGWIDSDRFDIVAKAEGDVPPGPDSPIPLMIRAMLADRFKLVVHNESRELPIYALVKARSDGKLGPQLRPATVDCAALAAARGRGGAPPPGGPGGPGAGGRGGPAVRVRRAGFRSGRPDSIGRPAVAACSGDQRTSRPAAAAWRNSRRSCRVVVGRTVVDRTGLYRNLRYRSDMDAGSDSAGAARPAAARRAAAAADRSEWPVDIYSGAGTAWAQTGIDERPGRRRRDRQRRASDGGLESVVATKPRSHERRLRATPDRCLIVSSLAGIARGDLRGGALRSGDVRWAARSRRDRHGVARRQTVRHHHRSARRLQACRSRRWRVDDSRRDARLLAGQPGRDGCGRLPAVYVGAEAACRSRRSRRIAGPAASNESG